MVTIQLQYYSCTQRERLHEIISHGNNLLAARTSSKLTAAPPIIKILYRYADRVHEPSECAVNSCVIVGFSAVAGSRP